MIEIKQCQPGHLYKSIFLVALLLLTHPWATVQQTSVSNRGKRFIFAFTAGGTPELRIRAISISTVVTVEYPTGVKKQLTVSTDDVAITPVTGYNSTLLADVVSKKRAVRVYADDDIEVFLHLKDSYDYQIEAAMALPISALSTKYVLLDNMVTSDIGRAVFTVTAPYANTKVTITPSTPLTGHSKAGKAFQVTLNAGETYFGSAEYSSSGASGTIVEATQPVSVSNGNYGDRYFFEVAQPVRNWGTTYATGFDYSLETVTYRIVVSQSQTTIKLNGRVLATLDPLRYKETTVVGPVLFTSTKPFFVAQYLTNNDHGSMANLAPIDQYLKSYTFRTVDFYSAYVSIVASNSDIGSLTLDDTPVDAKSFKPLNGTKLSYAHLELSRGTHTTSSSRAGHGITVYEYVASFGRYWSVDFPGGFRKVFPPPPTKKPTRRPTKKPTRRPTRRPTRKPA